MTTAQIATLCALCALAAFVFGVAYALNTLRANGYAMRRTVCTFCGQRMRIITNPQHFPLVMCSEACIDAYFEQRAEALTTIRTGGKS